MESNGRPHLLHLVQMTIAFLGIFFSYNTVQNLATSIIIPPMGSFSVGILYGVYMLSCISIAPILAEKMTTKLALVWGGVNYCWYFIACIYPSPWTLYLSAAVLGLGASVLWVAQGTYVTVSASNYADARGEDQKSAMGMFSGVFFGIFQLNAVFGNLFSSIILEAFHLPQTVLFIVFFIVAIISACSLLFLPVEKKNIKEDSIIDKQSVVQNIFQTFIIMKDKRMLFLTPFLFYSGFEQGFMSGDYTGYIVSKSIGAENIGFVLTVFGIVDVVTCFALGKISDLYGSKILVIVGLLAQSIVYIGLLIITMLPEWEIFLAENSFLLYIGAGVYAIGDAIWLSLPTILMSKLFTEDTEAAFSSLNFWQSFGFLLPFFWGPFLQIEIKIVVAFALVVFQVLILFFGDLCISPIDGPKQNVHIN